MGLFTQDMTHTQISFKKSAGQNSGIKSCIQSQWVFGLCPSSGILKTRKYDVSLLVIEVSCF
jgi:hypothetical protein